MQNNDYAPQLLIVRKKLIDLHKEFLTHLKDEFDFKSGHLSSPLEWFQIITTSPEYEWLKDFNSLVADIDILTELKPVTEGYAGTAKSEIRRLLMGGTLDNSSTFTPRYLKVLMSGSNILLYHHQVKTPLDQLPERAISASEAKVERALWHELQRSQAKKNRN